MKLIFATQNKNKVKELRQLMPSHIELLSLNDINCDDDIPETAPDLLGNATQKSTYVVNKFNVNCFADDTGLEIEALNNEPGVLSARYAGEQKDSNDNMDLVLKNLNDKSNRKARFRTAICLVINGEEKLFEGQVEGEIMSQKSGVDGFGYDPIFKPNGFDVTFAEMSLEDKNKISHRGRAVRKLIDYLETL
jgi:XTP/dITP diphosphohydrolase